MRGTLNQVTGRAGTEGALTILHCCKKCGLMPKDDVMCFFMETGDLRGPTRLAQSAAVLPAVLPRSTRPGPL